MGVCFISLLFAVLTLPAPTYAQLANDRSYLPQFWPDKHGQAAKQIRRRLAGPIEKIPDAMQINKVSVARQGLPALERTVFRTNPLASKQRAKACKLASEIGSNLAGISDRALKHRATPN